MANQATKAAVSGLASIPGRMLSDLIPQRTVDRAILEAATERGLAGEMSLQLISEILREELFRRMQFSVDPKLAKRRLIAVLEALEEAEAHGADSDLEQIEEEAKRWAIYFDWPEYRRLRSLLSAARAEQQNGRSSARLASEALEALRELRARIQEELLAQAQEISRLEQISARSGTESRDGRRLASLIDQLRSAQEQEAIAAPEIERAREIAARLGGSEGEEEKRSRHLANMGRDFAALLQSRPDLAEKHRLLSEASSEEVSAWLAKLESEQAAALKAQQQELSTIETLLEGSDLSEVKVDLEVARSALAAGNLAGPELARLRGTAAAFDRGGGEDAAKAMERAMQLSEIERSLKHIGMASSELENQVEEARSALSQGFEADLDAIWNTLEIEMGVAADEREAAQSRAKKVVARYDAIRDLAGEQTQKLGRVAEQLRGQLRLTQMSEEGKRRFSEALEEAQSLLESAEEEHTKAQEVTAGFQHDALAELLDVFDFANPKKASETQADGEGGTLEMPTSIRAEDQAAAAVQEGDPARSPEEQVADQRQEATPAMEAAEAESSWAAAESQPNQAGGFSVLGALLDPTKAASKVGIQEAAAQPLKADQWICHQGKIHRGAEDERARLMAQTLEASEGLFLQRFDTADPTRVWSGRRLGSGRWKVARARSWDELEEKHGAWLEDEEN